MLCCVPGCWSQSKRRKKEENLSFHQFPADYERCLKWLKVINRKDFNPYANNGCALVCSKHFLPSDYRHSVSGLRLLINTAVPSLFLAYPMYMHSKPKKIRKSRAIQKKELFELNEQKSVGNTDISKKIVMKQVNFSQSEVSAATQKAQEVIIKSGEKSALSNKKYVNQSNLTELQKVPEPEFSIKREEFTIEPDENSAIKNSFFDQLALTCKQESNTTSNKLFTIKTVESLNKNSFNFCIHKSIQVSPECRNKSTLANFPCLRNKRLLNFYERKMNYYEKKMEEMKNKIVSVKAEYASFKNRPFIRSLLNVSKDAENGDQSASYLMNLIVNYNKNKYKCVDIQFQNLMGSIIK